MKLPLFIALRYTFSRKEQKFISFVSLISLLGTILGVSTMVLVLSVMNGFDQELKQRLLSMLPHMMLQSDAGMDDWRTLARDLEQQDGVLAVAPWVEGKGLLGFGHQHVPVQVNGIDAHAELQVSEIQNKMLLGDLQVLAESRHAIILGQSLARKLRVVRGDPVDLLLPQLSVSPAGVYPRRKRFTVSGIYYSATEIDSYAVYIALPVAQKLFVANRGVDRWRIKTADMHAVKQLQLRLQQQWLDRQPQNLQQLLHFSTWADTHKPLFAAIKMEKRMVAILLFAIVAVAVFNIVSILLMLVADKRREIAILRVMGATTNTLRLCFVIQGMLIGVLGLMIGLVIGSLLACWGADLLRLMPALDGRNYLARLPSDWRLSDVGLIAFVTVVLTFLATLYPAGQSAKLNPVEGINV